MDDLYDDDEAFPSFRYRWDVFLSFRGEDTRHNFTDRLYNALVLHGVRTFRDDEGLERGDEVTPALLEAIQDSAAAVAVLSENYADSRWCLEELATIFDRRKLLLPVFYGVDPSHVRRQEGPFRPGIQKLEQKWGEEMGLRWRKAMEKAGNISGWDSRVWEEQELIQSLVNRILKKLGNTPLGVAKYPVGLEKRIGQLKEKIDVHANEVLIIGFYGMGGSGKTTLAKALYNKIVGQYERRSFISEVREDSQQEGGLQALQSKLIADLSSSKGSGTRINEVRDGIRMIKERAFEHKILVVLDDVGDVTQLNALAGSRDWFYKGSLIIVSTRDKDVLPESIVNEYYEVAQLNGQESIQLFSFHAFGRDSPNQNLSALTAQIVSLTGGLPLALEVYGSFLYDKRRIKEWQDALQKLKCSRPGHLQSILEISFYALDAQEKRIFLDIACFFVKMKMTREDTIYVFRACDFNGEISIKVLAAKSLLKVLEGDILWMHDQIRDMGREIVQKESNDYPGQRSRLWDRDEILTVLKKKTGTARIQGITLDLEKNDNVNLKRNLGFISYLKQLLKNWFSHKEEENDQHHDLTLHTSSFKSMTNLRLLQINHATMDGSFKNMPSDLRWLQWKGCPMEALPFDGCPQNLGILDISYSTKITRVWEKNLWNSSTRKEMAKKLLVMNLQDCYHLKEIPDLSGFAMLEKLILQRCKGLVTVHESVGDNAALVTLDLSDCENLLELPSDVSGLKNLQKLILFGCNQLKELPEDLTRMRSLKELAIDSTAVGRLPQSIFRLKNLEKFSLKRCRFLKQLPQCIGELRSLKHLALDDSGIEQLPDSIGSLIELEELTLVGCTSLTSFPDTIGDLKSLTHLYFGRSSVRELPASVGKLWRLKYISGERCRYLTALPESVEGLSSLVVFNFSSTPILQLPYQIGALKMVKDFSISWCMKLSSLPESIGNMLNLTKLSLDEIPVTELPDSLGNLEGLQSLSLKNCRQLQGLPSSIGNLKSLTHLWMKETSVLALPEEFGKLSSLQILNMRKQPQPELIENAEEIPEQSDQKRSSVLDIMLPKSFSNLCSLKELDAHAWGLTGKLSDDLERLTSLESLDLAYNNFHTLPSSLKGLRLLRTLKLTNCRSLRTLPQLPSGLFILELANCKALESISELSNLENLHELNMTNCHNITDIPGLQEMKSLRRLFLGGCKACLPAVKKRLEKVALKNLYNLCIPGSDVPSWFDPEIPSFRAPKNCKIIGIIFAVVVSLSNENPNNIKSKLPAIVDVKAGIMRLNINIHTTVLNFMGVPDACEDQLYLIRFPEFKPFVKLLEGGDNIHIFLRDEPYFPGIQIKKKGICLVFENDDDYDGNEEWMDASQQSISHKLAHFIGSL